MKTYPLLQSQLGVLLQSMQHPDSTQYNLPNYTFMPLAMTMKRIVSAWHTILQSFPEFHTRFVTDEQGEIRQWCDMEMLPNAPIGILSGWEYEGEEIETIKGRPLFIYTDGLNEAENKEKEQFTDERLLEILRNTQFSSARQVIESLSVEVEAHRNGAEPNDDLTMMCIHLS